MNRPADSPQPASDSQYTLLDTVQRYGRITRLLHWLMALLIVWQFVGMGLRLWLGRTPLVSFFVNLHPAVGTLVFLLILVRIAWAWHNRQHRPPQAQGVAGLMAKLGHAALYGLMLIIPALGLLRLFGSGRGYSPFGVELLAASGQEITWTVALADRLHGELAWTLMALALGHIIMVIVHEKHWRDGTLSRMKG